jgi:hypothetical protein
MSSTEDRPAKRLRADTEPPSLLPDNWVEVAKWADVCTYAQLRSCSKDLARRLPLRSPRLFELGQLVKPAMLASVVHYVRSCIIAMYPVPARIDRQPLPAQPRSRIAYLRTMGVYAIIADQPAILAAIVGNWFPLANAHYDAQYPWPWLWLVVALIYQRHCLFFYLTSVVKLEQTREATPSDWAMLRLVQAAHVGSTRYVEAAMARDLVLVALRSLTGTAESRHVLHWLLDKEAKHRVHLTVADIETRLIEACRRRAHDVFVLVLAQWRTALKRDHRYKYEKREPLLFEGALIHPCLAVRVSPRAGEWHVPALGLLLERASVEDLDELDRDPDWSWSINARKVVEKLPPHTYSTPMIQYHVPEATRQAWYERFLKGGFPPATDEWLQRKLAWTRE